VNGGTAAKGAINKYSLDGKLIYEYPVQLDMRTILFNPQDGGLYVSAHTDQGLYKITDLNSGTFELKYANAFDDGQDCLGLSPDGNYLYAFNDGTLKKLDFSTGRLVKTFTGLSSGASSNFVVAVDNENIYTFDSDSKKVFVYDLDAKYITSLEIPEGSFRFSMSIANGLLFTSDDGNSGTGVWYGYKIKNTKTGNNRRNYNQGSSGTASLSMQFDDNLARHNMHLTSDGGSIYTVNGGGADGEINRYNIKGEFIKKYYVGLDMRSIFFNPQDGALYVSALDQNIYKITNLESGTFQKKFSQLYENGQASLAASADGNYIYYFDHGSLKKFDFNNGRLLQTYSDLKYGESSPTTVAADYEYIYTFDSENKTVYVYDLDLNFKKTLTLPDGDFSFSLSTGINLLFVAKDGNYATGTWYGYQVH
jgi:hypothetical protein